MKSCILLMRLPYSEGEAWRIGEAVRAKGDSLFLLGDAVAGARKEFRGHASSIVSGALGRGAKVSASARDLRARGIEVSELHEGIKVVEDIEGDFIDMAMNQAERVIAW
ncbi:MAG: DsrH/TusB family sulfur relay protein [Methanomassiliicoccales archaeon]|nr:DsrH/TusB family sulfur relay protein [Methanomassiliicoccales archaeon]